MPLDFCHPEAPHKKLRHAGVDVSSLMMHRGQYPWRQWLHVAAAGDLSSLQRSRRTLRPHAKAVSKVNIAGHASPNPEHDGH
jgi:hypothetical protein